MHIAKSGNYVKVLKAIGQLLNIFAELNILVTTLDITLLNAETTFSGRIVKYVPLTLLELKSSLELFEKLLKQNNAISLCVVDCGGHGRTLEHLMVGFLA